MIYVARVHAYVALDSVEVVHCDLSIGPTYAAGFLGVVASGIVFLVDSNIGARLDR
jgi:hypothetical protein